MLEFLRKHARHCKAKPLHISNIFTKRSITAEVLRFFFASTHAMWNETYLHQTHKRPPRHVFMFWVVK